MAASDEKLKRERVNIPKFMPSFHAPAVKIPMKYFIDHEQ